MRKLIVILFILLIISGCKKKPETPSAYCPCLNSSNVSFYTAIEDSNQFYPLILGKWYLKQQNNFQATTTKSCYCDTQYTIDILPNKSLILNIPGYMHDTVAYSFPSDTGNLIYTGSGTFSIPGDTLQPGQIFYSSNFLILNTQFSGNNAIIYMPNFYFTRN